MPRQKFWYLATPFTKYPHGLEAACELAIEQRDILVDAGIPVFTAIASVCAIGEKTGMPVDQPMMDLAHGVVMLRAESWERSYGMEKEREYFEAEGRPVIYMDPGVIPVELMPCAE